MTSSLFTESDLAATFDSETALILLKREALGYSVHVHDAYRRTQPDEFTVWDKALEGGRDYLVGDKVPMEQFIRDHRSPLTAWQKLAFDWVTANPDKILTLNKENPPMAWTISRRGEYVDFALPHQDAGGEKNYISRDCRTKVQVNED